MRRHPALAALVTAMSLGLATARADGLEPVELEETAFNEASLTIAGPEGEKTYTPAELEGFGTYRMVTSTPWREKPAVFEGPLLADLLDAHGLADTAAIRVTAENDYAVVIPHEVWAERPVMIATRVDGMAHRRRERGPLQFVFLMDDEPALDDQEFEANWVWMAERIEPAE